MSPKPVRREAPPPDDQGVTARSWTKRDRTDMAREVCDALWGTREGFVYCALGVEGHFVGKRYTFNWRRYWFDWPSDADEFVTGAIDESEEADVFFGPMLRSGSGGDKESCIGGRHAWADIDSGASDRERLASEATALGARPLLVSSGRNHHLYVDVADWEPWRTIEELNRLLAAVLGGDSKFAVNGVLRLPGTWNHKGRACGRESFRVELLDG